MRRATEAAAGDSKRTERSDDQVHNEAIVISEAVDAIRALTGLERDGAKSMANTNAAMGMRQELVSGATR